MGALFGLAGACVFVFSYAAGLEAPIPMVAYIAVVVLVLATLWSLLVQPRWIGPFLPAKVWQIGVYLLCVVAELVLIGVGTRWLTAMDRVELRPALIAFVVGMHFLPFAWAFRERMFYVLGASLIFLGGAGLLINERTGALAAAVGSGLIMPSLLLAYSFGAFAQGRERRT